MLHKARPSAAAARYLNPAREAFGMSNDGSSPFPSRSVAALILCHEGKILTAFNRKWGSYTLPMTKQRLQADENVDVPPQPED